MEFLKKHYEKIILSVVLLGMAVAAALLPLKVSQVREDLQQATRVFESKKIKPLPELDLTTNMAVLQRVRNPGKYNIAAPGHNLFNPIQWKKKADGTPVPSELFGLNSLVVTNISPLLLKIEYRGPRDSGGDLRYDFIVTREASTNNAARGPSPRTVALGGKTDVLAVKDVQGPKENPTEILIELVDSKHTVSVSKEKPYSEVAGYMADLRYETEGKAFLRQRQGQKISFGGGTYNIIAISPSDVTLEDNKTKKRTRISLKASQ